MYNIRILKLKRKPKMTRINIYIRRDQRNQLVKRANESRVYGYSDLIRQAIDEFIQKANENK